MSTRCFRLILRTDNHIDEMIMMKKDLLISVLVAGVSLISAAVFHRFSPGLGALLKPLLWPLVVLPFLVRPRFTAGTSLSVPLLSCAVNGMPTLAVSVSLSFLVFGFIVAFYAARYVLFDQGLTIIVR